MQCLWRKSKVTAGNFEKTSTDTQTRTHLKIRCSEGRQLRAFPEKEASLGGGAGGPAEKGQMACGHHLSGPYLVHVDVVEVVLVVNGLEHALQLPRGAAVDH